MFFFTLYLVFKSRCLLAGNKTPCRNPSTTWMLGQAMQGRALRNWGWARAILALRWGAGLQHFRSWLSLALEGSQPLAGAAPAGGAPITLIILVAPGLGSEAISSSSWEGGQLPMAPQPDRGWLCSQCS